MDIVKNTIGKNHVQEDNESKNQESNRPRKLSQLKMYHPSWSQGVAEGKTLHAKDTCQCLHAFLPGKDQTANRHKCSRGLCFKGMHTWGIVHALCQLSPAYQRKMTGITARNR